MKSKSLTYAKHILMPCLLLSVIAGVFTGALIFAFKVTASAVIDLSGRLYALVRADLRLLPLLLLGAALAGLAAAFILYHAPNCRGGGIPTAVALLRGLISFQWLESVCFLFASAMLTFLCGVPLGNEGPSVQMGTAVGRGTVRAFARKNAAWDRYIMTGGACAGFAAATGAPLTGIFFVFEEAHRRFSPMIFMAAAVSALSGSAVMQALCHATNIPYAMFGEIAQATLPLRHIWAALLVGVAAGVCALLFTKAYRAIGELLKKGLSVIPFAVKIVAVFVCTATVGCFALHSIGSGHDLIHELLHGKGLWYWLLLLLGIRALLLIVANRVGVTGGLFVPSLTFGAIVGALLARALVGVGALPEEYAVVMILVGMTSFLSASARTPITAIAFAIEVLGGLANILPLALGATFAFLVIETAGVVAFNETVIEGKIEDENKGKTTSIIDTHLTVQEGAFVIGKEIRDILWPPTCVVLSVHRPSASDDEDENEAEAESHIPGISVGDVLHVHYQTCTPSETWKSLEALVGLQSAHVPTRVVFGDGSQKVPDQ